MHPGFQYWWKLRHGGTKHGAGTGGGAQHGAHAGCGGWFGHGHGRSQHEHFEGELRWGPRFGGDDGDLGGSAFGVRRPLRFLAAKLRLDDEQVAELARILDDLKTERAQGEVDRRRSLAAFADAITSATFDRDRAVGGAGLRVDSATRLRDAVVEALGKLHALLDEEQRGRLAYLIRTGALQI